MPIKLAENFRAVSYAPFYATQALGFYAQEGIEVELINSPTPAAAVSDLLKGIIDLSWGGPMRVMKARENNPNSPLVCFCEVVARDPFFLVGRGDRPEFRLTDLTRLRLATVSEVPTPWLCLQEDLRQHGIDPDRLERVTNRTMAENLEALRRGEVDVAQMFEPYASMALKLGIGNILYAASTRGPTVYTTFLATRDSIERNRTSFAAVVRAVRRMQSWLVDHGPEELAAVVQPFYPNVASELLASSLQRYHNAGLWTRFPEVSREGFARLSAGLLSGGFISRMHAYEDCVDQSLY
ncbi:MAG TPA: ABC transporter substrate-binding protein [Xanthobacteraceae bacterium]|nr:ABC transporter substrate-binding protein [Xanthobacteraceae bacterium]